MAIRIEVSIGELLDKMTILEIKSERIQDPVKLSNVNKELAILRRTWAASALNQTDVSSQMDRLKKINETLWDIEDRIRRKEAEKIFDDEFIQLARSVYENNDERAAIKRELNQILGSEIIEEKSYPDYS